MDGLDYVFTDVVKLWQGSSRWYYVSLPVEMSNEVLTLSKYHQVKRRGWGAIKVQAHILGTASKQPLREQVVWQTSIFPAFKNGLYQLFLKADVRKLSGIGVADAVTVQLRLIF
ncbi:DUF1905 domain-containing protein [Methylophilus aquaticus]|uniref:DUF1905 domain-containing protein n=1 Tax=Methylophilus aquaticus TaxID=1971610 RepID=A0ABT9JSB2_9PROT|nr:DUF1905 domain-containing protein [Methylophilus aquaticus]MDP8567374.1 DUF1905 domain-containing protein [Methylophilus aquaticus]